MENNTPIGKRKPKGEIKYKFSLNEEQKELKKSIFENEIIIINAKSGSGKTACVSQSVLDLLFKKEVSEILLTRPTVEVGNSLGYLPGSQIEKLSPYLQAFVEAMYDCYDKEKIDKHLKDGDIKGEAIQFIRGRNIGKGKVLICDESQNASVSDIYALLTRIAKGGKLIFIGDIYQIDTKQAYTGLHYLIDMAKNIEGMKLHTLKTNHRSDIVAEIIDYEYARRKRLSNE